MSAKPVKSTEKIESYTLDLHLDADRDCLWLFLAGVGAGLQSYFELIFKND